MVYSETNFGQYGHKPTLPALGGAFEPMKSTTRKSTNGKYRCNNNNYTSEFYTGNHANNNGCKRSTR